MNKPKNQENWKSSIDFLSFLKCLFPITFLPEIHSSIHALRIHYNFMLPRVILESLSFVAAGADLLSRCPLFQGNFFKTIDVLCLARMDCLPVSSFKGNCTVFFCFEKGIFIQSTYFLQTWFSRTTPGKIFATGCFRKMILKSYQILNKFRRCKANT